MRTNGGFQISKIKQLGDRVFEKILTAQGVEAFNGAQGRILYVLWQEDGVPIKTISERCGLAITSLTTMLERMEKSGLIIRQQDSGDKRKILIFLTDTTMFLPCFLTIKSCMNAVRLTTMIPSRARWNVQLKNILRLNEKGIAG